MSVLKHIVVTMGDSTTAGDFTSAPYATQLELLLGPQYLCINRGHIGDTSTQMNALYTSTVKNLYIKPSSGYHRILTMCIGVNDFATQTPGSNGAANTIAAASMTEIALTYNAAIAETHWDLIVLMTPFPANGYFTNIAGQTGIATYGPYMEYGYEGVSGGTGGPSSNTSCLVYQIQNLSVAGLTIFDANTLLRTTESAYPQILSPGNTTINSISHTSTKPNYATQQSSGNTDFLHPGTFGHAAVAQGLYSIIKSAGL